MQLVVAAAKTLADMCMKIGSMVAACLHGSMYQHCRLAAVICPMVTVGSVIFKHFILPMAALCVDVDDRHLTAQGQNKPSKLPASNTVHFRAQTSILSDEQQ